MDFGAGGKTGLGVTISADVGGFELGGTASASAGELRCLATINKDDLQMQL